MAVVLGTSSGFVTVAPVDDPAGTGVTIDGSSVVTKDTSPATAFKIVEIGWYRASGTNAANWELALYGETGGVAATRLQWLNTNSTNANGWLAVPVNWLISPNTAYWLGLQMDTHSGSSSVDSAASGGAGSDVMTGQTTLANPYGGGAVADADGMYAIYALWEPVPSGAVAFPITFEPVVDGTATSPPETFYGEVISPFAFGEVASGRLTAKSTMDAPLAFESVAQGTRVLRGLVDLPLVLGEAVSGTNVLRGAVSLEELLSVVTQGDVSGGAETYFGIVDSPFALQLTSSGILMVFAHPTFDSVDGAWTDQGGGFDLEGAVDEAEVSDADYIRSELGPVDSACRLKLEPLSDPDTSEGHRIHWRIGKSAIAGGAIDMEVRLYEGGGDVLGAGSLIASFARSNVDPGFTTYAEVLSGAQADTITDYADLYVELEATVA